MSINGFDTPDQLTAKIISDAKNAKHIAAGRYISGGGAWKHLTATEIALCKAANFGLWLIDEGAGNKEQFATGLDGGHKAGSALAKVANQLGVPAGTPSFVGVDYSADQEDVTNIHNYMIGYAASCVPYKAGMYADGLIASQVPTAVGDFVPGALGWPGTVQYLKTGKVALIQHLPTTMFGIDVDPVEILDQSVLWFPGGSNGLPATNTDNSSSSSGVSTSAIDKIKQIQTILGVTADGIFGRKSYAALYDLTLSNLT
jgi:glycoside hydrolase-like protein